VIRINLIRTDEASAERLAASVLAIYLMVLTALASAHVGLGWRIAALAETRDLLRLEIARKQSAVVRPTPRRETAESIDPARVGWRLRRIAEAAPPDLWLLGYKERHSEVAMHGMTSSDEASRVFVENLAAISVFQDLEITETSSKPSAGTERRDDGRLQEFLLKAQLRPEGRTGKSGEPDGQRQ
jgi:hypothetical protein